MAAYRGTYALDFAYEDWAANYRDNLHAAVLGVVEAGVRAATTDGDAELAIALAQRVLAIDPAADAIELELLRAYKAADGTRQPPSSTPTTRAYLQG